MSERRLLSAAVAAAVLAGGCAPRGEGMKMCETREVPGAVTMKGRPLTLVGNAVKVGQPAPDFEAVDGDWRPVKLSNFPGKVLLIASVPSLDTGVCSLETRRFNEEAARLGDDVVVLVISQDLPFAQSRFCAAEKIGRVKVLSDHVGRSFGLNWGLLIKENALLARAVAVVDRGGKVAYFQLVKELSQHPDYDAALAAARKAAGEK